jgi:protease I
MASPTLKGLKVAILITDGFELVEMTRPRQRLDDSGAETKIVSPKKDQVRSWNFTEWDRSFPVNVKLDQAEPKDFDALLLPGASSIQTPCESSQGLWLS